MPYFAELDANNIVIAVRPAPDALEGKEAELSQRTGAVYKQTSYNTRGGQHPENRPLRKNYAGVGYTYDAQRDAFIAPQPFNSWLLNEATCQWAAPIPHPADGGEYTWDEDSQQWTPITP